MDKKSTKFSGLNMTQKLRAQAGRGGNQVSESPMPASRPGVAVSHPCPPGTLMSPDRQVRGMSFQRAPGPVPQQSSSGAGARHGGE